MRQELNQQIEQSFYIRLQNRVLDDLQQRFADIQLERDIEYERLLDQQILLLDQELLNAPVVEQVQNNQQLNQQFNHFLYVEKYN